MDDLADAAAVADETGADAAPPAQTETGPQPALKVDIGESHARQTNFAQTINQFFEEPDDARTFSVDMDASTILPGPEKELMELAMVDGAFTEKTIEHLERHRVLLLTGDGRMGKATTAKYVATRLAEAHELKFNTYVVEPLERRIRIIVRKIAEDGERFGSRVTIFTDALARRNRDLMAFFTADRAAWEQLSSALQSINAYLIFTASTVDLGPLHSKLSIARHDVQALSPALIAAGVERKLAWLQKNQAARDARIGILRENRRHLQEVLKTPPNIVAFIDDFVKGDLDFDVALGRWSAPSYCFLDDLAGDVDAWCFALTLALTEATPNEEPVSWFDFELLRREITELIKTDNEIFPRRRFRSDQDPDEAPERTTGATLTDDALTERCRVKVAKDRSGYRDVVFFDDPARSAEVWQSVLFHNRRVLMKIVPVLRSIAENRGKTSNLSLRILAAQIIGRIGVIDPGAIVLPLIERVWTGSRDSLLRALVGRLLQGVLASGNARYVQAALGALEELKDTDGQADEETRNRLLTAVAAYSQLGDYGPAKAMEHLGDIAIEHCAPFMAEAHVLFLMAEKAERDRSRTSYRRAEMLRAKGKGLGRRAYRMLAQQQPMLAALEQALVYLCMATEPVETLAATRDWVSRGGESTAMLLTILFLRENGIADRLEAFAVEVDGFPTPALTPLILSLASGRESVRDLCGFLADLHGSVNTAFSLPIDVQRELQERFAACLTMWARGAAAAPPYREAVEDLFVALSAARGGALRREIYTLLGEASFADGETMRSFAASVRKRIGS